MKVKASKHPRKKTPDVELDGLQRSLLDAVYRKTDLPKDFIIKNLLTAGLHALRENDYTFSPPLCFRVVTEKK
jgi:hypothetical protein